MHSFFPSSSHMLSGSTDRPPPCNFFYLAHCKHGDKCKYAHDFIFGPEHMAELRKNAKKWPCPELNRSMLSIYSLCVSYADGAIDQPCLMGTDCPMAHQCPHGSKCIYAKTGKCKFSSKSYLLHGRSYLLHVFSQSTCMEVHRRRRTSRKCPPRPLSEARARRRRRTHTARARQHFPTPHTTTYLSLPSVHLRVCPCRKRRCRRAARFRRCEELR